MGGLGNQMFQYAAARNISLITGEEIVFDLSFMSNKNHERYSLDHCFIPNVKKNLKSTFKDKLKIKLFNCLISNKLDAKTQYEKLKKYQLLFNTIGLYCVFDGYIKICHRNSNKKKLLYGYFQSSKYFDYNKDIIKKELMIKDDVPNALLKQIKKSNSVCVHVRRGDYTQLKDYLVCDADYYNCAIRILKKDLKDCTFFIFSDDIKWARKSILEKNCIFIEHNSASQDLKLMYNCKHFIISNSSYSWWACYLANNSKKIVISPNRWYNNGRESDLIMPQFILLDKDNNWEKIN